MILGVTGIGRHEPISITAHPFIGVRSICLQSPSVEVKTGGNAAMKWRLSMRTWQWLGAGLAVLVIAALVFPLVLTQNRLRAAQSELEQVRGSKTKLESVVGSVKTELELASKARDESEANLNGQLTYPEIEDGVERRAIPTQRGDDTKRKTDASASRSEASPRGS